MCNKIIKLVVANLKSFAHVLLLDPLSSVGHKLRSIGLDRRLAERLKRRRQSTAHLLQLFGDFLLNARVLELIEDGLDGKLAFKTLGRVFESEEARLSRIAELEYLANFVGVDQTDDLSEKGRAKKLNQRLALIFFLSEFAAKVVINEVKQFLLILWGVDQSDDFINAQFAQIAIISLEDRLLLSSTSAQTQIFADNRRIDFLSQLIDNNLTIGINVLIASGLKGTELSAEFVLDKADHLLFSGVLFYVTLSISQGDCAYFTNHQILLLWD